MVFDANMLSDLTQSNRIAVSAILPWMNGATISLNDDKTVSMFHLPANKGVQGHYKTVNICSLSLKSWYRILNRLNQLFFGINPPVALGT
ncbi:MAG: hypothetical protein DRQ61_05780 [Gammaproteobacteria bacterium]|nr:MAG: hypothetical protein DRQ61_05780 [Gammaproteobacteria bacterium]